MNFGTLMRGVPIVLSGLLVSGFGMGEETPGESKSNVIEFVTQPKNSKGTIVCALFDKSGWLTKPVKPAWAKPRSGKAVCLFKDVQPGVYGISMYHDENDNRQLDKNVFGAPTEDYGASRDARGTFGPPSFDDAKFSYKGGKLRLFAQLK